MKAHTIKNKPFSWITVINTTIIFTPQKCCTDFVQFIVNDKDDFYVDINYMKIKFMKP